MAKDSDKAPRSGPVGNKDNSKRGRDIPRGGRPSKGGPSGSGGGDSQTNRSNDDPDTDGYSVGGR